MAFGGIGSRFDWSNGTYRSFLPNAIAQLPLPATKHTHMSPLKIDFDTILSRFRPKRTYVIDDDGSRPIRSLCVWWEKDDNFLPTIPVKNGPLFAFSIITIPKFGKKCRRKWFIKIESHSRRPKEDTRCPRGWDEWGTQVVAAAWVM